MTDFPPAPNWRRIAAMVYDSLILMAISMVYGAIMTGAGVAIYGEPPEGQYLPMFESPFFGVGWLLVLMFFYCYFWRTKGQTVGMRAWRLKVIPINAADSGENISWKLCFIRSLIGLIGFILVGINYWYRWINPQGDCLHDKLSQSRVTVLPKFKKKKK